MRFWNLAIYNLGRRPLRSALTVLGIAVAVACLVVMVGLSRGLERAWINNLHARGTQRVEIEPCTLRLGRFTNELRTAPSIEPDTLP